MEEFKKLLLCISWFIFISVIIIGFFEINSNVGLIVLGIIGSLHVIYYLDE